MKTKFIQDQIYKEQHQIDYLYDSGDRALLQELFSCLNRTLGSDYHYLAEIAYQCVPGGSSIVQSFFDRFSSEGVRAYLLPQLLLDKPLSCDKAVYNGYLRFKNSDAYIAEKGTPAPAHIYASYDNAFKALKPKRLQNELICFANCPRDVVYLPFTMKMVASWRPPDFEKLIIRYLSATKMTQREFGGSIDSLPNLDYMRKQVLFTAISCAAFYPSERIIELLQGFLNDEDENIRFSSQKALKKIEKYNQRQFSD